MSAVDFSDEPRCKHPGPPETCKRILRAARKVIREQGSAKFTIRAVAQEAGVSPGLVIQYYGTKAGLIHQMFMLSNFPVQQWLDEHIDTVKSPTDLAFGLIMDRVRRDMQEKDLTREVMALTWIWNDEDEGQYKPYLRELSQIAASALERRFYPGEFQLTVVAAFAIVGVYVGVLRNGAQQDWSIKKFEEILHPAIAMIMAGLDVQAGPHQP